MDKHRPVLQIKDAHPRLREYVFYLERKNKTRHGLILKIEALELEVKQLKEKNHELKSLNYNLQRDQILGQVTSNSDIAAVTVEADKTENIIKINNSMDNLKISANEVDDDNFEASLKLSAFDESKLPIINRNTNYKIIKSTDNGKPDTDNDSDIEDSDNTDDDDAGTDCNTDDDEDSANSIIIKHVTKNHINNGLERFIHDLSRSMNIKLCTDGTNNDIKAVNERKRKFINTNDTDSVILLVCFYTRQMKINFLQYKEKLKKHPTFCSLEIEDYVSDRTFQLYQYAKILKHQYNYAAIYWRNNRVYGQKSKSTTDCVEIKSRTHVNKLKKLEKEQDLVKHNMKKFKKAKRITQIK